jgi:hypothetical protein
MDGDMVETLKLLAGQSSSGAPAYEEVLAEQQSTKRYKLLKSPGLVQGLAAGDVFEPLPDGTFNVIERGRNLCIQIFGRADMNPVERLATERLGVLGGRPDGQSKRELVYTVPIAAGFPAVEAVLNELVARFPEAEWYFGNVYDPSDGVTPLNWWMDA